MTSQTHFLLVFQRSPSQLTFRHCSPAALSEFKALDQRQGQRNQGPPAFEVPGETVGFLPVLGGNG